MRVPIPDGDLNTILLNLISSPHIYYAESNAFFSDLYFTGCRTQELYELNRWRGDFDNLELFPFKNNHFRLFESNELSTTWYDSFVNGGPAYNGITIYQMELELKKRIEQYPLFVEDKRIDFYAFRYNFVKLAYIDFGGDEEIIRQQMGWTTTAMVTLYNTRIIETDL